MLHKEFFGLIFLGFVFWIIAATSPSERIANGCRPVGWGGNIIVSVSALALPAQQATIQSWFDKLEYGCRYATWRLFYQESYNQWLAANPVQPKAATVVPGTPAASPTGTAQPVAPPATPAASATSAPAAAASAPTSSSSPDAAAAPVAPSSK